MRRTTVTIILTAASAIAVAAIAQDAIVRTPLQKSEFPGPEHVTHLMLITVAPGGVVAPHTHPGIEMGYLLEGEAVDVDRRPAGAATQGGRFLPGAGRRGAQRQEYRHDADQDRRHVRRREVQAAGDPGEIIRLTRCRRRIRAARCDGRELHRPSPVNDEVPPPRSVAQMSELLPDFNGFVAISW